jgi:hypothetical protein
MCGSIHQNKKSSKKEQATKSSNDKPVVSFVQYYCLLTNQITALTLAAHLPVHLSINT